MSRLVEFLPSVGNVLIVSNNCGGGHESACDYVERELDESGKRLDSIRIEYFKYAFGDWIAGCITDSWNQAQKGEDVAALNRYLDNQWMDTVFLSGWIFIKYFFFMLINGVDVVIDTQPMSLQAIIRAARVVDWARSFFGFKKAPIQFKLIMTELPTEKTQNFFYPITWLSEGDKKNFKLITTKPLLQKVETEEASWEKNCNLSFDKDIVYDQLPVRPAFHRYADGDIEISELSVKFASREEKEMIGDCYGDGFCDYVTDEDTLTFPVAVEDQVSSIMLGSQACVEATKEYVRELIRLAKKDQNPQHTHYVFVLCDRNKGPDSLFKQVHDVVLQERGISSFPKHVKVVPLTFQTDEELAPMLSESNVTITKSGGLTAMELHTVAHGRKILLHATPKDRDPCSMTDDEIRDTGMPLWEAGNADHLADQKGARVVTPDTFSWVMQQVQASR